ncbi:unnamed protein product [Vitrella brassicaformis CCMP3155]|uniref:3-deoxy-7-phosphoheptulonate synthase n=2 Tax=Vitrella brassicaformis TaxID=1169539 RepID=A0A0G4EGN9_VITBC|nr:unnamed protein product [Vitrella brassicaformis CCMP3155]|mmetsp:Transcript_40811/g.102016  ORF Transcript_40811/g.102016 Transcript_40811/m.102016 type:complete len:402 (+) Transcript_40811:148-1353(+)|eukprot:CEL94660.1 unnamed protein product [Vitrella brassicaformis CCMP3155]
MASGKAADAFRSGQGKSTQHFEEYYADPDVDNLRIEKMHAVVYPQLLMEEIPVTARAKKTVLSARDEMADIVQGRDNRLAVIVGPCSIHDAQAAREYASKLVVEAERLKDDLRIIMRVYFEKPRTTVGWKGLINDPDLDGSFHINKGLREARRLLADINDMGLPVGCEFLDTLVPQYTCDLVAWGAIGARTTESQLHRELASGLSMPVGFKNGTSGDIQIAVDAVRSTSHPHCFLGITKQGLPAIVHSMGNPDCHVILRGGANGPNYDTASVRATVEKLNKAKVNSRLVIDCSHGNSSKDFRRQPIVSEDIAGQLSNGEDNIIGVMIESHLFEGRQEIPAADPPASKPDGGISSSPPAVLKQMRYGVSVTDACVGWSDTVPMLNKLAEASRARRQLMAQKK